MPAYHTALLRPDRQLSAQGVVRWAGTMIRQCSMSSGCLRPTEPACPDRVHGGTAAPLAWQG